MIPTMLRRAMLFAATWAPLIYGVVSRNRKTILVSAVLTPVLLGVWVAADPKPRRALFRLVPLIAAFDVVYALVLYYIWLRLPWG